MSLHIDVGEIQKGGEGMYLFSRVAIPNGQPRDVMEFATDMTDYVNSKVDTTTTLWGNLFGAPLGTLAWNTLVPSRAKLGEVMMTLMADDEYHARLERGAQFRSEVNLTEDFLARFIFGDTEEDAPGVGAVAEMIVAVPAAGRMADAMAWGPEIAQKVAKVIDTMPSFWSSAYGPFGQVSWITLYPDMAALDEAQDRLLSNEEYMTAAAKGSELFTEGSGQRSSAMRLH